MKTQHQRIVYNGTILHLTNDPYLDTVDIRIGDTVEMIRGNVYRAHAVDVQDNSYSIYWTKLRNTPDGLEVADWDVYMVVL